MVFIPPHELLFGFKDLDVENKPKEKEMGHKDLIGQRQVATEAAQAYVLRGMQETYDTYKYKLTSDYSRLEHARLWSTILSTAAIELMDPLVGDMDPVHALGQAKELLGKLKL